MTLDTVESAEPCRPEAPHLGLAATRCTVRDLHGPGLGGHKPVILTQYNVAMRIVSKTDHHLILRCYPWITVIMCTIGALGFASAVVSAIDTERPTFLVLGYAFGVLLSTWYAWYMIEFVDVNFDKSKAQIDIRRRGLRGKVGQVLQLADFKTATVTSDSEGVNGILIHLNSQPDPVLVPATNNGLAMREDSATNLAIAIMWWCRDAQQA